MKARIRALIYYSIYRKLVFVFLLAALHIVRLIYLKKYVPIMHTTRMGYAYTFNWIIKEYLDL